MLEMLLMLAERVSDEDSTILELVLQCICAVLKKENPTSLLEVPDTKDVST